MKNLKEFLCRCIQIIKVELNNLFVSRTHNVHQSRLYRISKVIKGKLHQSQTWIHTQSS